MPYDTKAPKQMGYEPICATRQVPDRVTPFFFTTRIAKTAWEGLELTASRCLSLLHHLLPPQANFGRSPGSAKNADKSISMLIATDEKHFQETHTQRPPDRRRNFSPVYGLERCITKNTSMMLSTSVFRLQVWDQVT